MTLSIPLMGADFFDGFYDSNYYFGFCFSGFQYALAVYPLRPALHRIWFIRNGENNEYIVSILPLNEAKMGIKSQYC